MFFLFVIVNIYIYIYIYICMQLCQVLFLQASVLCRSMLSCICHCIEKVLCQLVREKCKT